MRVFMSVNSALEREREERKEAELSVASFERQLMSVKEQGTLLDVEIEQRRAVVTNLQRGEQQYILLLPADVHYFLLRTKSRALYPQRLRLTHVG